MKGDFMWAVAQMKEGKKVRRGCWRNEKYYLALDNYAYIGRYSGDKSTRETAGFTGKDVEATNWEIVEEKRTLSDKIITADGLHHEVRVCIEEDVKEAIKEFIDFVLNNSSREQEEDFKQKAKEIFGERLIK